MPQKPGGGETPRLSRGEQRTAKQPLTPRPDESSDSGIKVLIRVRPFSNKEEQELIEEYGNVHPVVETESNFTNLVLLDHMADFSEKHSFCFDYCITPFAPRKIVFDEDSDSSSDSDIPEGSQEQVYEKTGLPALENAWQGYNACVFAYGQTSSGKTYTMMGSKKEPGIIPRVCRTLFERIEEMHEQQAEGKKKTAKVQVTFMEIYNEQVKDLLRPPDKAPKQFQSRFDERPMGEYQTLRVRHHPLHGPFVEGITKKDVESWSHCVELIRLGTQTRASTATSMNEASSRSHAIFQLCITQTEHLGAKLKGQPITSNRTSKLNLVDLAGSERTSRTEVKGKHLAEANHINKSLMTLRKVIDTLVANVNKDKEHQRLPPYRESLLTWILADNFGGNAKTIMIANVSPSPKNASETESTLRYATTAKGIVNRVKVNEDASAKLIRELQAQIKELQEAKVMAEKKAEGGTASRIKELEEEIYLSNKAIEELRDREQDLQVITERFRHREKELLEEQEKMRQRVLKLEGESAALRAELAATKKQQVPAALTASAEGQRALRDTKASKAHFWLDELAEEAGRGQSNSAANPQQAAPSGGEKKKGRRAGQEGKMKKKKSTSALSSGDTPKLPPDSSTSFNPIVSPTDEPTPGNAAPLALEPTPSASPSRVKAGRRARGSEPNSSSAPPPKRCSSPLADTPVRTVTSSDQPSTLSPYASPSLDTSELAKGRTMVISPPTGNSTPNYLALSKGSASNSTMGCAHGSLTERPPPPLPPGKSVSIGADALDDMLAPALSGTLVTKPTQQEPTVGEMIAFTEVDGNKDVFDSMFKPSPLTSLLRKRGGDSANSSRAGSSNAPTRTPHSVPLTHGPSTAPPQNGGMRKK